VWLRQVILDTAGVKVPLSDVDHSIVNWNKEAIDASTPPDKTTPDDKKKMQEAHHTRAVRLRERIRRKEMQKSTRERIRAKERLHNHKWKR